jgi:glycosyltransferase involved in cell wall biosynthesis
VETGRQANMRIALLSWESLHSVAVGGVAAHVSELAAALAALGQQVHVFTREGSSSRVHDVIDGVHYHRCAYPAQPDFVDDVNRMCRALVDRVFAIEDAIGPFDIVHGHDWLTANAVIWIKQARGRRCVMTIHSTEYARCGNCIADGRSHRIRVQEGAGTYWADRVIAVSAATRDEIGWMYDVPDWKVSVVYNGVVPERFDIEVAAGAVKRSCGIGAEDPVILFCGRLAYQKGPDLLLDAVPVLLQQCAQAKFLLAGDGEMRDELQGRVAQLGIEPAVRFLGYRNGRELPQIYRAADGVCVPSRNEPFGIVATRVGGPDEYIDDDLNGIKVDPVAESIAGGLGRLLQDPAGALPLGARGRETVRNRFTWPLIAEETLSVYDPGRRRAHHDGTVTANAAARSRSNGRRAALDAALAYLPDWDADGRAALARPGAVSTAGSHHTVPA